ncbi:MAG: twin-arginine translocation signal domain-containing protein [Candidatus Hydrogenedentes bacterium]|nr:twin-arginine translocation signal domain-containing protein [Candidatus Hydrogenedentota bacterium]
MKKSSEGISRRELLKGAAALTTAGAIFPQIVPRHVVGGKGFTPPSETIYVAGIGVGSMGGYDLRASRAVPARKSSRCAMWTSATRGRPLRIFLTRLGTRTTAGYWRKRRESTRSSSERPTIRTP